MIEKVEYLIPYPFQLIKLEYFMKKKSNHKTDIIFNNVKR